MSANLNKQPANGFTLLEVVVAVAIASVALVALFQIGGTALFAVSEANRVDQAVERAQSRLAAFSRVITPGDSQGDDGAGYRWRLIARPIAMQVSSPSAQARSTTALYDIEVVISWKSQGRRDRSVALSTQRIGNAPPQQ